MLNQADEKEKSLANYAMAKQKLCKVNNKFIIPKFRQSAKFSNYQKVLIIGRYQNFWNSIPGMSGNTSQPHRNSGGKYVENTKFLILATTIFQNFNK